MNIDISTILKFLKRFSSSIGGGLESIMTLVILIEKGLVPWWAWPMVAGAFAYLISPLDALPDPIFIDDLGVIGGVLGILSCYITDDIREEARRRVQKIFG